MTPEPQTMEEQFVAHLQMVAQSRGSLHRRDGLGRVWDSCEALLLDMAGPPTLVPELTLPEGMKAGRAKECFYNAFIATLDHPYLTFVEGYAMTEGMFPVNHAWCLDRTTDRIVDPTWAGLSTQRPVMYLGLPFSRQFLSEVMDADGLAPSVFESDWKHRGRTARRGLVLDTDGLVIGWGEPG